MTPKTYINGLFVVERETRFGPILSVSIPADKLDSIVEQLRQNESNGWIHLKIERRREPKKNDAGKVTATHNVSVDDWKPGQTSSRQMPAQQVQQGLQQMRSEIASGDEEIPF